MSDPERDPNSKARGAPDPPSPQSSFALRSQQRRVEKLERSKLRYGSTRAAPDRVAGGPSSSGSPPNPTTRRSSSSAAEPGLPAPDLARVSTKESISQQEWEPMLKRDELHTPEPEPPEPTEKSSPLEKHREKAAVDALLHSVRSAFPPEPERTMERSVEEKLRERAFTAGGDAPRPASSAAPVRSDELRDQAIRAARKAGNAASSARPKARVLGAINIKPPPEAAPPRKGRPAGNEP